MRKKIGRNDPCICGRGKKYKKCCMEKVQRKPRDTFDIFFGEDWINNKLSKVKLSGFNNLNPMNIQAMHPHPLIEAIVGTQRKLQHASINRDPIVYGWHEAFQNLTHTILTSLEEELDLESVKKRLRDKKEFDKIFYELFIASGYKRYGNNVKIIETTSDRRTGKFYVESNTQTVLVECKKKDIRSENEKRVDNWWVEFQHLLMKKLKADKKHCGIFILIPKNADKKDIPLLIDKIIKTIEENNERTFDLLYNKYHLKIEKFCPNDEQSVTSDTFYNFGRDLDIDASVSRCLQNKSLDASTVKEPFTICCKTFSESIDSKVDAIISTISQAYGQLEDDKPNIVYVDTNIATMLPNKIQELFKKLKPAIITKLDKDFSKISAVVLTNFRFMKSVRDGLGIYCMQDTVINSNAKIKIPNDFKIYGDMETGIDILKDIQIL